jgi:hypothetical protein
MTSSTTQNALPRLRNKRKVTAQVSHQGVHNREEVSEHGADGLLVITFTYHPSLWDLCRAVSARSLMRMQCLALASIANQGHRGPTVGEHY